MPRICEFCGKKTQVGNKVSRRGLPKKDGGIGLKTTGIRRRTFKPNLQKVRAIVEGKARRVASAPPASRRGADEADEAADPGGGAGATADRSLRTRASIVHPARVDARACARAYALRQTGPVADDPAHARVRARISAVVDGVAPDLLAGGGWRPSPSPSSSNHGRTACARIGAASRRRAARAGSGRRAPRAARGARRRRGGARRRSPRRTTARRSARSGSRAPRRAQAASRRWACAAA